MIKFLNKKIVLLIVLLLFPLTIQASGWFGQTGYIFIKAKVIEDKGYEDCLFRPKGCGNICKMDTKNNLIEFQNIYFSNAPTEVKSAYINKKTNIGDVLFVIGKISDSWAVYACTQSEKMGSTSGYTVVSPYLVFNFTDNFLISPWLFLFILLIIIWKNKHNLFNYLIKLRYKYLNSRSKI